MRLTGNFPTWEVSGLAELIFQPTFTDSVCGVFAVGLLGLAAVAAGLR